MRGRRAARVCVGAIRAADTTRQRPSGIRWRRAVDNDQHAHVDDEHAANDADNHHPGLHNHLTNPHDHRTNPHDHRTNRHDHHPNGHHYLERHHDNWCNLARTNHNDPDRNHDDAGMSNVDPDDPSWSRR